ncbi:MAG: glycosyltransferase family 2 protein, partial [Acidobacteriia bacterium]|nr:glycosyltransferase family 2 protein [Terriglobia bacterium]
DATAKNTQGIVHSRIWRILVLLGGVLLSISRFGRRGSAIPASAELKDPGSDYQQWIADFEGRDDVAIRQRLSHFTNRPRISIITPCLQAHPKALKRTVASVLGQSCSEWEWCLAGARSGQAVPHDPRIRTNWLERQPGEAAVWNAALELASGEYIALLEPGGVLAQDALFHVLDLLNREPATDVVYSDQDSIDEAGRRARAFFKPDWSPDLLLSMNYVGGLLLFRRALAAGAGGFRSGAGLSQDYDLLLRLVERTSRIRHIPRVLYHEPSARPKRDLEADRRVVEDHLRRTHSAAWTEPAAAGGNWRVRYPVPLDARVSIIIPAGGKVDLLETCLDELAAKTDYPQYEIVLIDNSKDEAVERFARGWSAGSRTVRYIDWRWKPFNFSTICNVAARQCDSPFLLFLNDDTAVITHDWLRTMVELGARPEVGAVGARLLFPNGQIQHVGITLGLYGSCGHVFKGLDSGQPCYFGLDRVIRNVSAVTGACLLIRAAVFREAGGFDEDRFPVHANDPDLCLRIAAKGYRVLYTPYAQMYHYESMSKTHFDHHASPPESRGFCQRWAESIRNDPFYSPNLTRLDVDCSPRKRGE